LSGNPFRIDTDITLDQLVALNDEMAALARAGVPLDKGLLHIGSDLPGRLGQITRGIGQRLEQGEPLSRVLEEGRGLPPSYCAVVAAGIRSGRLAVALEGMSSVIRRAADMRRLIIISMIYPLIVLAVAYVLFSFTVLRCLPAMLAVYRENTKDSRVLQVLDWVHRTAPDWLPWLPVVALVLLVLWWLISSKTWSLRGTGRARSRYPTAAGLLYVGRMATYADTLALMVEHDVPMNEAVTLAAGASGDRGLAAASGRLAACIERGESINGRDLGEAPPVLAWLLTGSRDKTTLISSLRRSADSYRRHADWMMRWLSLYLPIWLVAVIGGTVVVVYAVSVVGLWSRMLHDLSMPF
jgi:general secretion pathway protein F